MSITEFTRASEQQFRVLKFAARLFEELTKRTLFRRFAGFASAAREFPQAAAFSVLHHQELEPRQGVEACRTTRTDR